jgi:hypothetical protein
VLIFVCLNYIIIMVMIICIEPVRELAVLLLYITIDLNEVSPGVPLNCMIVTLLSYN